MKKVICWLLGHKWKKRIRVIPMRYCPRCGVDEVDEEMIKAINWRRELLKMHGLMDKDVKFFEELIKND